MSQNHRYAALAAVMLSTASSAGWAATPVHDAAAFYQTIDYSIADSQLAYSPDGGRLLITANPAGVFNVYELDLKSGGQKALTQSTTNAIFAISWFPDGQRYLYTFDEGGNELNHVYVGGGEGAPRDLTPGEKLKASFVGWVNGGAAFVLATNERDEKFFDLYRYDAGDFSRKLVFQNNLGLDNFEVSRSGSHAAAVKPRTSADDDIWLVPLAGGGEPSS